jgi:hypothetical protein
MNCPDQWINIKSFYSENAADTFTAHDEQAQSFEEFEWLLRFIDHHEWF